MRTIKVFAVLMSLLFAAFACDGDGDTTPTDTAKQDVVSDTAQPGDTAQPPEDTGQPPEDTAEPPEDTAEPPEDTAEPPEGVCLNDPDLAVLCNPEIDTNAVGAGCALGEFGGQPCLTDTACLVTCVAEQLGISEACAMCFAGVTACGVTYCMAECTTEGMEAECEACLGENCFPDFYTCAGQFDAACPGD